jgi:hypothetical protein
LLVAGWVLVGLVVDDLQDLDEPKRRPQPPQRRILMRVDLGLTSSCEP